MDPKVIGLILGALVVGALGGYFVGGSVGGQASQLQSQINTLQAQVSSLQSQITNLQAEKTALQAEINRLTALIPPEPPKEGELGSSRFFPAPIGMAIPVIFTYSGGQYSAKITVKQIVRGDAAWGMIYDANTLARFNDPPFTGYEYILAKVRFELTSAPTAETAFQVSAYRGVFDVAYLRYQIGFEAVSGVGSIYEAAYLLYPPEPKIDTTLYQGAYNEGWCAFLIEKTDTTPMMAFALRTDGTGGIWLKLYP